MGSKIINGDLVLLDINTGEEFILDRNESTYTCGRGRSNHILSQSILASRRHCMFVRTNDGLDVIDFGSSNGIYINGVHQQPKVMTALKINDVIGLGCPDFRPDPAHNPKSRTILKLLALDASKKNVCTVAPIVKTAAIVKTASNKNKRKQTEDSSERIIPPKVAKIVGQQSTPDIIDITDESYDQSKNLSTDVVKQSPSVSFPPSNCEKIDATDNVRTANASDFRTSKKKSTRVDEKKTTESNVKSKSKSNDEINGRISEAPKVDCKSRTSFDVNPQIFDKNDKKQTEVCKEITNLRSVKDERSASAADKKNPSNEEKKNCAKFDNVRRRKPNRIISDIDDDTAVQQVVVDDEIEQLIKWEPELTIIDDDDPLNTKKNDDDDEDIFSAPVAQTPIKLKRVKQEPKTGYSEFDVVLLSDDEDGVVFPASQLFGDESDDEIFDGSRKVRVKNEDVDENDGDIFQDWRDDVPETIVLSDSDGDDNPWYDRLLRGQMLNDSRLSLDNSENSPKNIKTENSSVVTETNDENLEIFDAVNDENDPIPTEDVTEEIYNLCFAKQDDDSKLPTNRCKYDDKRKIVTAEPTDEEVEEKSAKKIDADATLKISKNNNNEISMKNKIHDEKISSEKKTATDEKRTAKRGKSSSDTILSATKEKTNIFEDKSRRSVGKLKSVKKRSRDDKSIEKSDENRVKQIGKSCKNERTLMNHDDGKSSTISDDSNVTEFDTELTKSLSKTKPTIEEKSVRIDSRSRPIVVVQRIDCVKNKVVVSSEKKIDRDKSSDKPDNAVAKRLIVTNDIFSEKERSRKLTGKEKKELTRRARSEEKLRAKEQRHRRLKNKWAAECLPLMKKIVPSTLTREQRLEIATDRKEKLRKIATEKKNFDDAEPSSTMRRTTVKAKVTTNSRNDFLVKQLSERRTNQSCPNAEQSVAKNVDETKNSVDEKNTVETNESTNVSTEKDKDRVVLLKRLPKIPKLPNAQKSSAIVVEPQTDRTAKKKSIVNGVRSKTTKRVSFDDKATTMRVFEIETGNSLNKCVTKDARLVVKKLTRCNTANTSKACCPKLEQFLLHIFRWNPVWLEEQKLFNTAPPVVDDKKLVPLLSKYASYEDYYNVAEPLLALELWYGITRDCEVGKAVQQPCFKFSIVNHSVVLTTVPSTDPSTPVRVSTLMLEVVISQREAQSQRHPVYGDLVFFEYISTKTAKEACPRWKVFAYVTNVRQVVITSMTHFNRGLLPYVKDPHILVTYTVMTKPLDPTTVQTNRVSRLRTITYLRSNIRMIQALQSLPVSPLCNAILYPKTEDYQLPRPTGNYDDYPIVTNDKLNANQLEAVVRITEATVQRLPKICLVQGPPGTGKSRVIVNLVTQILYGNNRYRSNKKLRILVCAPSNAAVDEIVLRLLRVRKTFEKGNRFNMVRMGRTETMHPQVREVSITELAIKDVKKTTETYSSPSFTNDSIEEEKRFLQARINALELDKANAATRQDPMYGKQIRRKLGDIQAKYDLLINRRTADRLDPGELARLQRAAENTLLNGADVITCTLKSCYTNHMEAIFAGKDSISVCIVDEATQSSEAETLIPLMLGVRTLVLVGDTNQLPATIISQRAKKLGLDQSLFARIKNAFEDAENNPIITLDTQYRMSYPVAYWPNRYFYGGILKNAADKYNLPFHCYKIMNLDSTQDDDKFSNDDEATFVANLVYTIMTRSNIENSAGPVKIGIITPYNNQRQMVVKKIRERTALVSEKMKKNITHEVKTIDSFQGQERDIIIISCVRSSGIGFLSDRQRLCVALTRAKHSMILCGNFKTFQRDPMWSALIEDANKRGVYINIKANAEPDEIKKHVIR